MTTRPRILCLSLSPIVRDSRVLRQIALLAEFGDVTTVGFGPRPAMVVDHRELPETPTLPQTPVGVLALALRRYRSAEVRAPAVRAAAAAIGAERFDLIVANEARVLPLAHLVARGAPIWGDMHEWAPEERTQVLSWRLLVAPFMRWICAEYLPRTVAVTTVGSAIARMYDEQFGTQAEVVRNAGPALPLTPQPLVPGRVRLVHSGAAVPGRNIEALITGTLAAGERFSLDLYLVPAGDGGQHLRRLHELAGGSERVVFHDPVPPGELPAALNRYDLGVYCVPLITANHRFMLPNKFFDFVQARLGLVFSPSVEIDSLIDRFDLGVTTADATSAAFTRALETITSDDVERYKANADTAARAELSSTADDATVRGIVARLLA